MDQSAVPDRAPDLRIPEKTMVERTGTVQLASKAGRTGDEKNLQGSEKDVFAAEERARACPGISDRA